MTLQEAARLVAAHFKTHEVRQTGLNAEGAAGALVAGEQLHFEYLPKTGVLRCAALIYRWRDWAVPGLLEALRQEAAGGSDTGGGALDYVPERKTLSLVREYASVPSAEAFERDQARLRAACTQWREETFARVAERVRHPSSG